jgi:hypothetical protein
MWYSTCPQMVAVISIEGGCHLYWWWFFSFTQASESEGDVELTSLCDVTCIAPWRSAAVCCAEGAPVWSSFGEWGRLFVSHSIAHMDLCEWRRLTSFYTQAMLGCTLNAVLVMSCLLCSPCWSFPSCSSWGSCSIWARLFDGETTKFGNLSTKVVQLRWRCLRYKRQWWNRPKRLVDVWVLSYWRLKFYVLYSFGVILALVDIRLLMAKYITLATCNCGQSGGAKEFVGCIQAHVYSCLGAHVTLLPSKILQVGRSPSFLWKAW